MIVGKFELPKHGACIVRANKDFSILTACLDGNNNLCVYAKVDMNAEKVGHHFRIVYTGEDLARLSVSAYVGTVRNPDGIVSHILYEGVQDDN